MKARKRFITIVAIVLSLLMLFSVLISVLSSMAGAVSQSDIDSLNEQKAALQSEQAVLESEIADLQSEQATVLEQKAALDERNELARQEIELINEQIDIYDQLIENKSDELEEAIAAQEEQTEKYQTRIRAMEEEGTVSYLAILFDATSFSDLLSRLDMIWEIMENDSQLEAEFIAASEHVAQVKAEYEETLAEQEVVQAELLARKADLEQQIEEAYELIAEIEADIESHQAEYLANEAAEEELDAEINALIAELEAQRQAEEAARQAEEAARQAEEAARQAEEAARQEQAQAQAQEEGQQNSTDNTVTGDTTPSSETTSGTFIWPTTGYTISSSYGYRIHPIFGTQKFHAGIDIAVSSGQPIYAAASGTVVTAVYSSSYGYYVMIDHGNGYYTLYAHMTQYIVSNGQSVSQGDVIGYVGSTGWSTGPHLHYEVRVNGSTVDPMSFY